MSRRLSRILAGALSADRHLHDAGSHDGTGTPYEYALCARQKGLSSIGITNHGEEFDSGTGRFEVLIPRDLNKALETRKQILEARTALPDMDIRFGIEFENNPRCYPQMEEMLSRIPFDYVVGSVHLVDGVPISNAHSKPWMSKQDPHYLYERYYQEMSDFVEWGKFDVLGHPDIIKRYMVELFPGVKPRVPYDILRNIFTLLRNRGQALEINTSGLFQAPKECYPSVEIIELALDCGVERFSIGSDAHRPEDVGRGYDIFAEMMQR